MRFPMPSTAAIRQYAIGSTGMSKPGAEVTKLAMLYQATAPPSFGGVVKPRKESGYRDSCADIAVAISKITPASHPNANIEVVLPNHTKDNLPSETDDAAWSFPDTKEGIEDAIKRGANTLWLNTVIHRKHPLFGLYKPVLKGSPTTSLRFVGQLPEHSEDYDDKAVVNPWLANTDETKVLADGFPKSLVLAQKSTSTEEGFDKGMKKIKEELGLPCVLKPIRGRGSHGVAVVHDEQELRTHSAKLFKECPEILAEEFLNGEEITIAIMPPGSFDAPVGEKKSHWTLPIVIRSQHINDITPYNGVQPVAENSAAITPQQYAKDPVEYARVEERVKRAGEIMQLKAVGRIDCRRNQQGEFKLFDVNMKPNATGPSREGREKQTSLVGMAAEAMRWDYPTLLVNQIRAATPLEPINPSGHA